ncbi:conserved hypothetical protein [Candidatus Protochlamydia naegleriophila]|uniref:ATP-grasp domain-containing protein n=1 Tax=Candidatus Protochlamydia naegleriophila TaxID=389348 RepID=A0A0U5JB16_9BACT|nr:hypothetical protein [Candidatus Protochlamydia naegleriophila]CUI15874.1 conserved hypothetical protein [Candidatus Protochlamydia naegleriophila]
MQTLYCDLFMKAVHLANTDFEFELANLHNQPLARQWSRNALCMQLQFLPLLYAAQGDLVAVAAFPSQLFLDALQNVSWRKGVELPSLAHLDGMEPFRGHNCLSWGSSQQVQRWAKEREMIYYAPTDWQMIKEINSKSFSFRYTSLEDAALITSAQELSAWLKQVPGSKVLKTCFGLSGKGNRVVHQEAPLQGLLNFCEKEWNEGRPVVAEPWLDRCFDFSTQWMIHPDGQCRLLGSTVFETDPHGAYLGTLVGPDNLLFGPLLCHLNAHLKAAQEALKDLFEKGFFGHVGIDALLYRCPKSLQIKLYPIVEINARQTMSLVALRLQQRWFPDQVIRLAFAPSEDPRPALLPLEVYTKDSQNPIRTFKRKLVLSEYEAGLIQTFADEKLNDFI